MVRAAFAVLLAVAAARMAAAADADGGFGSGVGSVDPDAPSYPDHTPALGSSVLIACTSHAHGRELWSTDGSASGTRLLTDIAPGPSSSDPWQLTRVGSRVFFSADDGIHGRELWVSDGSAAGTVMVADLAAGPASSFPGHLTAVGSRLFFTAFEPGIGYGLWSSDGGAAGTVKVKDIDPSATADEFSYNWHHVFCAVGDRLFFNASDPQHGSTLWTSDGTALGTRRVIDVDAGQPGSIPISMAAFRGKLFFASVGDGSRVWSSDGSAAGTARFSDRLTASDYLTAIDDRLWVRASDGGDTNRIWVTHGTAADLTQVSSTLTAPGWFVGAGGRVFMAPDAPAGFSYRPLVASDGAAAGTAVVADLGVGNIGWYANLPFGVGDRLFFTSASGAPDGRLYVSDGTAAGTGRVTDRITDAAPVGSVGSRVLITQSSDIDAFTELWSSDGSDAGTKRLFPPGPTVLAVAQSPMAGSSISRSPSRIVVTFSRALDRATVVPAAVRLVGSGGDSGFSEGNEIEVAPAAVTLTAPATLAIDLDGVLPDDRYRLVIAGSGRDALRDGDGLALDGDLPGAALAALPSGDDVAGGDFNADFVLDTQSPTLAFTAPVPAGGTYATSAAAPIIAGACSDAAGLAEVTWTLSGATVGGGTANGAAAWSFAAPIDAGSTTVSVTARDLAGNTTTGAIVIERDPSAVAIGIAAPASTGTYATTAAAVTIAGSAASSHAIVSVAYALSGATTASGVAAGTTAWSFAVPALGAGDTTAIVMATDALGAVGTSRLLLTRDVVAPTLSASVIVLHGTVAEAITAVRIAGGTNSVAASVDRSAHTWTARIPAPAVRTTLRIVASDGQMESSSTITVDPLIEIGSGGG